MNILRRYWFVILALAIFGAGIISALTGIVALRKKSERLSLSTLMLKRMVILENKAGSVERAMKVLDGMDKRVPEDLSVLIEKAGLTDKVGDKRDAVGRLDDNWSVLTRDVTFPDVILADVDRFVSECRQSRPPWVVTKVSVKSSPFESGRGQVSLTMQALRGKSE